MIVGVKRRAPGGSRASPVGFRGRRRRVTTLSRLVRPIGRSFTGTAQPIFTECYNGGTISTGGVSAGSGGIFQVALTDLPQVASYQALYRTFRILKMEVIVIPNQNVNTGVSPATGAVGLMPFVPYFAHSIDNSNDLVAPTSEAEVLENDGVHLTQLTKALHIKLAPVPALQVTGTGAGGAVGVDLPNRWLAFDDAGVAVKHNGVSWWMNNYAGSASTSSQSTLFYKVTFQCRDPR